MGTSCRSQCTTLCSTREVPSPELQVVGVGGGGGGGGPARRVSSPDIKLNSLRRTTHQSSQENNTTDSRKKIVRRGSFQGTPRGAGGRGSEVHQGRAHSVTTSPLSPNSHRSTQSLTTGGGGSFQKESLTNSTGSGRCHPTPQLRGGSSTGVSAGTEVHLSNARSQASWSGGTPPDPQLRQSQEIAVGTIRLPLKNRGDAWQLEEEEEEMGGRGRGGRPSGHVDEALFSTRIPRHYFHSSLPSHHHTITASQSSSSSSYRQEVGETGVPYNHWSLPVGDRHPQQVTTPTAPEGSGNSAHNTTLDKKHRSHDQRRESRKILATQQQRVAEWVKGQSDGAAAVSVETGTNSHMTQSLPRPMRRTPTPESGSHWQCPTRTFSYIQAQVHPVTAQDSPPHKGFDVDQMMSEHRRLSNTSDGGEEEQQHDSVFSSEVKPPQKKQRPRPMSSPHPHRARTRSSPNPVLRWNVNNKVKEEGGGGGRGGGRENEVERRVSRDSLHPDKRFSTGNILEEKQAPAKFSSRRSASPADEKGRVICHTPTNNGLEEETSSDDTGGQSDSESVIRKNKGQQRSKSSTGGIISKIARRLGRGSSVKPDSHNSSEDLPTSGEGEGVREDLVQSANHSLKVPTPRMQQKKLKSMSTSHLETSFDGSHYRQNSLTDRYSPDYFEGRGQDDGWYRSQGTPPPSSGTPYGTPYGTPKMSRASSRSRQRSAEPDPDSLGGLHAVFRSGSKRNLSADVHETLLDFVEQGNFDGVEQLLESNSVTDLNIASEDDFTLVDLAAMLGHHDIAKLLLSKGARDSTRCELRLNSILKLEENKFPHP
ncbi:hypothetical protein GBAR_LOCUS17169 [Geodia barretti]|uniref:Uncharacterized protein n=1 Tax=Geodia barretti TaxID=519541 RepID=A0AA35SJI0_GEOBA|nr:hypothetical protein GBAR_LOCUS17169 [Geodia barretti]